MAAAAVPLRSTASQRPRRLHICWKQGAEESVGSASALASADADPPNASGLEMQLKAAAKRLEFEEAAQLRDRIQELRAERVYRA